MILEPIAKLICQLKSLFWVISRPFSSANLTIGSWKLGICIGTVAFAIYVYINQHNQVIELQLAIPPLQKEFRVLQAENERLQFEIDRFESPGHLMELAKKPEYRHLKSPSSSDILVITNE